MLAQINSVIANVAGAAPPDNALLVPVYGAYAAVSIGLTVWLARVLSRNGQVFLDDVFEGRPALSKAVNQLLVVGFYLVNMGYAALIMKADHGQMFAVDAVEVLVGKLGLLLISLAGMHFLNLLIFHRMRKNSESAKRYPVAPNAQVAPAAMGPGSAPGMQNQYWNYNQGSESNGGLEALAAARAHAKRAIEPAGEPEPA